jgi:hypothetical protein
MYENQESKPRDNDQCQFKLEEEIFSSAPSMGRIDDQPTDNQFRDHQTTKTPIVSVVCPYE